MMFLLKSKEGHQFIKILFPNKMYSSNTMATRMLSDQIIILLILETIF